MINGKFFTGLPPKMIERSGGLDRQQTNFFWPDDTQNQSAVDSRVKRRTSIQAQSRDAYIPSGHQSNSDAENKERFKKEFTKSSIEFYDNVEQTPVRRNRQKVSNPPPQKFQNLEPPVDTSGKRKENFSSTIEFYDYAEDLNNVPKTDKNNKVEVERNTKNSPKLQNKHLSFEPPPPEESINFIENDVRNMRITAAPPRRRHPIRDPRPPRYGRQPSKEDQHYSDFNEDYLPARRQPLPPPPIRNRYSESDPDFDEYTPRRLAMNRRPEFYDHDPVDYIDGRPSPSARLTRQQHYEETRKPGRQVHFTYSDNEHNSIDAASTSQDFQQYARQQAPPSQQQMMMTRKVNILKIDNDIRNSEHRTMPIGGTISTPPLNSGTPSHKHLQSNICFSDTESTMTPPAAGPPKRNIRSSAVSRVSVGLPD